MSDQTPAAYTIVPWVRRGLASSITAAPATNYASLPVTLRVNDTAVNAPAVRLIGPGQITGLDARAVVRTDPRDGAAGFEPNYMAMVELALPDLPWMFTPSPVVNGRLQPWICLVVVPDSEGIVIESDAGGISRLQIDAPLDPKTELPDLSTIDAWAHAQVTGANLSGDPLTAALNGDLSVTVSRLIAARQLEANQSYIACIVPTYRAGVNAGLGLPVDDQDLAPAWDANVSAPFTLPAYYVFRFQTGADGDFASLAEKIRPPAQKLDAGTRTMDVSQPGFGAAGVPGVTLGLEGALRTVGNSSTPWPAGAQAIYEAQFRAALAPPAAGDPVVAPPTYGSGQSGAGLPAAGSAPLWLSELNLDPRPRAAASAGSQIVQQDREALVASAWDQWGEIQKANRLLRQAQLAREVSTSMSQRHLDRVAGDGKWLQITAPLHSRVRVTLAGLTATMRGQVQASSLPTGSLSPAMRRIARPAGPIGRQLNAGVPRIVDRLNMPAGSGVTALQVAGPAQPPQGMVTFDAISADFQVRSMTVSSLAAAGGWKLATTTVSTTGVLTEALLTPAAPATPAESESKPAPVAASPPSPVSAKQSASTTSTVSTTGPVLTTGGSAAPPLIDWTTNPNLPVILSGTVATVPPPIVFPSDAAALEVVKTNFQTAAQSVNLYINTTPPPPPERAPLGGQAPLAPVRAQLAAALNPGNTLTARLGVRIPLGTGADPLQPMEVGPKFPQPMYAPLAELSPEWMLPGVSQVQEDCALLLATNPAFIEAYMVGLNDELSRELLWREFPADRTVTFFQSFWSAAIPDIGAIRGFDANADLGGHVADAATGNQIVLLVRATLFQRYPNAMVYAAQAQWVSGVRQLTDTLQFPVFRGTFGQDMTFFGFNIGDPKGSPDPSAGDAGWYFVIAEHVTEPRVGLEPEKKTNPTGLWNDLSWQEIQFKGSYIDVSVAPPMPSGELVAWSENSAALGYILMRRPVRVALHALALLGGA
jgi:hypothetical protein